jgi:large subunit ribosomal protein L25
MSELSNLPATSRDRAGKGAARATRRNGLVPGVIYGGKQAPTLIAIEPKHLVAEMRKPGFKARLFDIAVAGGATERALAKDVQLHPVSDMPVHVDFLRVSKDTVLHVNVPVHFINHEKSPGLKRGGVLNIVRHDVELVCAPDDIPTTLDIDLTGLDIGDTVHISAIKLPAGVKPAITDRDFTVASVAPPTVVRAESAGAGEGTAEA